MCLKMVVREQCQFFFKNDKFTLRRNFFDLLWVKELKNVDVFDQVQKLESNSKTFTKIEILAIETCLKEVDPMIRDVLIMLGA